MYRGASTTSQKACLTHLLETAPLKTSQLKFVVGGGIEAMRCARTDASAEADAHPHVTENSEPVSSSHQRSDLHSPRGVLLSVTQRTLRAM